MKLLDLTNKSDNELKVLLYDFGMERREIEINIDKVVNELNARYQKKLNEEMENGGNQNSS